MKKISREKLCFSLQRTVSCWGKLQTTRPRNKKFPRRPNRKSHAGRPRKTVWFFLPLSVESRTPVRRWANSFQARGSKFCGQSAQFVIRKNKNFARFPRFSTYYGGRGNTYDWLSHTKFPSKYDGWIYCRYTCGYKQIYRSN